MEAPGEKALIRLWETAEKCSIGFFRPWLLKREGRARAAAEYQNRMAIGQAECDLEEVKSGRARFDFNRGMLTAKTKALPLLPTLEALPSPSASTDGKQSTGTAVQIPRLSSALDFHEEVAKQTTTRDMRRAINLEKILQHAETATEEVPDEAVADRAVNDDWLARWRANAEDISDVDVQRLWARILNGEVQRPGRYSLRTLDFLRSVSHAEATLIEKIGPLAFDSFIYKEETFISSQGLTSTSLHDLEALGIINGVGGLGMQWSYQPHPDGHRGCHSHGFAIAIENPTKEVLIPCYGLTKLGIEVLSLGSFQANEKYIKSLITKLVKDGFTCYFGRSIHIQDKKFAVVPPLEEFRP